MLEYANHSKDLAGMRDADAEQHDSSGVDLYLTNVTRPKLRDLLTGKDQQQQLQVREAPPFPLCPITRMKLFIFTTAGNSAPCRLGKA